MKRLELKTILFYDNWLCAAVYLMALGISFKPRKFLEFLNPWITIVALSVTLTCDIDGIPSHLQAF